MRLISNGGITSDRGLSTSASIIFSPRDLSVVCVTTCPWGRARAPRCDKTAPAPLLPYHGRCCRSECKHGRERISMAPLTALAHASIRSDKRLRNVVATLRLLVQAHGDESAFWLRRARHSLSVDGPDTLSAASQTNRWWEYLEKASSEEQTGLAPRMVARSIHVSKRARFPRPRGSGAQMRSGQPSTAQPTAHRKSAT